MNAMKNRKLTSRIIVIITVFALAGLLAVYAVTQTLVRGIIYESAVEVVRRDVAINAMEIDNMFESGLQLVRNLSLISGSLSAEEDLANVIAGLIRNYDFVENVFVVTGGGRFFGAADWEYPLNWDITERPWYIDAAASGFFNPVIINPFTDLSGTAVLTAVSAWVPNVMGERALVGIIITLDALVETLNDRVLPFESYLVLVDENFDIVAHPTNPCFNPRLDGSRTNLNEVIECFSPENLAAADIYVSRFENYRGEMSYYLGEYLCSAGWTLLAIIPVEATNVPVGDLLSIMAAFAAVVVALLVFSFIFMLRAAKDIEAKESANSRLLASKEAEETVRARLRAMLDSSPLSCFILDENINVIDLNPETINLFEARDRNDFIENFHKAIPEKQPDGSDSKDKILEYLAETIKEGSASHEWMAKTFNGELIPCQITGRAISLGTVNASIVHLRDLRDFYRYKEAEQVASQRLQAMLDSSPLCAMIMDETFRVVECNTVALSLFGFSTKKEFMDNVYQIATGGMENADTEPSPLLGKITEAFENGYAITEWMAMNTEMERIPVQFTAVRVVLDRQKYVIIYLRDLRDFYQFKEISERTKIMFDATPLMIEFWDRNHVVLDCNKTKLNVLGLETVEEYIEYAKRNYGNSSLEGSVESWNEWSVQLDKIFKNGYGRFEYTQKDPKNGNIVHTEVDGIKIMLNNEEAVVTYAKDITKAKLLEEEQRRVKIAEESNRAKTMFIANMSHEIRTPMNSILGYSELALDGMISPATRGHLEKVVTNTKWLLNIINDVLDISKIESGTLELEEIPFDMEQIIEHCRSLFATDARAKGLELNFNIGNLRLGNNLLLGDPTKLIQIFVNLLSNAIKFTEKGSVSLSVTAAERTDGLCAVNFEFKDTGVGMTENQLFRIFEPFTQADTSTTRKYGGTGLGLAITKRLTEAMGGKLHVDSAPGKGSVFSFRLAFKIVGAGADFRAGGALVSKPYFDKGEILVVDDNDMNQGVACEHLRRVGLGPFIAENGEEAVELVKGRLEAKEKMFDLIFMDIHMPVMDGKESAKIIRGLGVTAPIIAMTAETIAFTGDNPYSVYGMDGFLSKPFTTQELWRCLIEHLNPDEAQVSHVPDTNKPYVRKTDTRKAEIMKPLDEDEQLMEKLKYQFVTSNRTTVHDIREALEKEDIQLAHRLAHNLKSSAALIGMTKLEYVAMEIELQLKSQLMDGENWLEDGIVDRLEAEMKPVLDELSMMTW